MRPRTGERALTLVDGEAEFWFALIKVLTITGLILLGIIIAAAPRYAPQPPSPYAPSGFGGSIGFYYWRQPGPFVQFDGVAGSLGRFLGFFSVLIQAAFSYIGTEITAIAAGEAKVRPGRVAHLTSPEPEAQHAESYPPCLRSYPALLPRRHRAYAAKT